MLCTHVQVLGVVAMVKNELQGCKVSYCWQDLYCPLLNSKFPLICIVGKHQKDHKPRSLNYCFFANQRALFFEMPFLHYKGFALTGHLKTAKGECLWSSAHCNVRIFVKQQNRQLQQILAVENKILQQLKPLTPYIMLQHTLIFHSHHTGMRSEKIYTNGSFEICQVRMFAKQRRTNGWNSYLPGKNIFVTKKKSLNVYIIMFEVSENVSEYAFMHTAAACVHKCFTLTGHRKSAKNDCLSNSVENTAEAVICSLH